MTQPQHYLYNHPNLLQQDYKPTVYIGPSMNPTLFAPDILEITPYTDISQIKIGDVIVFDSPREKKSITHRVIKITPNGIVTRGDNNSHADPWELKFSNITGRVDWAKKGKQRRHIWGGTAGRLFEAYVRARRLLLRGTAKGLRPFYRLCIKAEILKKFGRQFFSPKLVVFNRHGYSEQQLILGPWVIGRKMQGKNWRIRPPFKLLVDVNLLKG